jgi:hypothetical protein
MSSGKEATWPVVVQSAMDNPVLLTMVAGLLVAVVLLVGFIVITAIMGGDTTGPRAITVLDKLLGAVPRRDIPYAQAGTRTRFRRPRRPATTRAAKHCLRA